MSGMRKGLILGAIQIVMVLSLGGKLLYERVTRPRVWVMSEAYDPELPIRGRYVSERLQMQAEGFEYVTPDRPGMDYYVNRKWAYLQIRDNHLVAENRVAGLGMWIYVRKNAQGALTAVSDEPVLFFIPDKAQLPILKAGEQMWVDVTLPIAGPPRPIRIGIKKAGVITPLDLK
jgi:hypothetical protein